MTWTAAARLNGWIGSGGNRGSSIRLRLVPNLVKRAQIGGNGKEIIIASCCPECGITVSRQCSALPEPPHPPRPPRTTFPISVEPTAPHCGRDCVAFLPKYHSCTCFLSIMGDESRDYG